MVSYFYLIGFIHAELHNEQHTQLNNGITIDWTWALGIIMHNQRSDTAEQAQIIKVGINHFYVIRN